MVWVNETSILPLSKVRLMGTLEFDAFTLRDIDFSRIVKLSNKPKYLKSSRRNQGAKYKMKTSGRTGE